MSVSPLQMFSYRSPSLFLNLLPLYYTPQILDADLGTYAVEDTQSHSDAQTAMDTSYCAYPTAHILLPSCKRSDNDANIAWSLLWIASVLDMQ